MAHGAPDHIQISDDAYSHYTFTRLFPVAAGIGGFATITPVNENFVGVFGNSIIAMDSPDLIIRVYIDTVRIFDISARFTMNNLFLEDRAKEFDYGLSCYNPTDGEFCVWINTNYNVYVNNNLTITLTNPGAPPLNMLAMRCNIKKYR